MDDSVTNDAATQNPAAESNVLFVGNLSWNVRDAELAEFFTGVYTDESGKEVSFEPKKDETGAPMAKVVLDKFRENRSKGYGFVTFETVDQARAALMARNEKDLDSRPIRIQFKTDRPKDDTDRPRRRFNDRGGDRGDRNGGERRFRRRDDSYNVMMQ